MLDGETTANMRIAAKNNCFLLVFCVLFLASVTEGCSMQPVYLGYEVDLEEEPSEAPENPDAQDPNAPEGDGEAELPEPGFELGKRECRRLVRRYYSECRQDCFEDDPDCKERCERDARDFMRACLERAKKKPRPDDEDKNPDSDLFDKSKAFLKTLGDGTA